mmetsp:Transcript_68715/g.157815  ORF Transcript_68715/g.157815 Transcript_68715/m.157815 type:complete len:284 (+) Transcript_68715:539-1390(+)
MLRKARKAPARFSSSRAALAILSGTAAASGEWEGCAKKRARSARISPHCFESTCSGGLKRARTSSIGPCSSLSDFTNANSGAGTPPTTRMRALKAPSASPSLTSRERRRAWWERMSAKRSAMVPPRAASAAISAPLAASERSFCILRRRERKSAGSILLMNPRTRSVLLTWYRSKCPSKSCTLERAPERRKRNFGGGAEESSPSVMRMEAKARSRCASSSISRRYSQCSRARKMLSSSFCGASRESFARIPVASEEVKVSRQSDTPLVAFSSSGASSGTTTSL